MTALRHCRGFHGHGRFVYRPFRHGFGVDGFQKLKRLLAGRRSPVEVVDIGQPPVYVFGADAGEGVFPEECMGEVIQILPVFPLASCG